MNDISRTLAAYIVESRFDDLPDAVRHEAARALVNWVGCAIGGARHETVDRALAALSAFFGAPQAGILGRPERADILSAALINGISSSVLDFDDTLGQLHPSPPVLPALLALAEWRGASGEDLVLALVLGVEAACRIALSVTPEHYDAGWHLTGTAGIFGAATASGKLLGLDERQMTWAIGIAATKSAGVREMFGSMCKSLHPGRAAQNGLSAALLASRDFTSSLRPIEAPRGFGHVLSTKFDPGPITDGLGAHFQLLSNTYKPYACGLVVQAAIDGCIELRREHRLAPEAIERIDLGVCPIVMEVTANPCPLTGLEGKFSVFHAAAVATILGSAGEAQFSDGCVRDPRVVSLRERVTATPDPGLSMTEARVAIHLTDGRIVSRHVEHALGTLGRPMSDADLETKFRSQTEHLLGPAQRDELLRLCWSVATLKDAGAVARAAITAGPAVAPRPPESGATRSSA